MPSISPIHPFVSAMSSAGVQVCFEFVESVKHVRTDVQHRASDACMLMCTGVP